MVHKFDIHFKAKIETDSVSKVSVNTEYDDMEEFMKNHMHDLVNWVTGKIKKKNNKILKVVIVKITDHQPRKTGKATKRLVKLMGR